MKKTEGWDIRLSEFLAENKDRKFERGVHDCALFAADCLKVMTGEDHGAPYRNKYKTLAGANKMIEHLGNTDLLALACSVVGEPMENMNFASRGDIVAVKYKRDIALCVIDLSGRKAVTAGQDGLEYFDRPLWLKAWRV